MTPEEAIIKAAEISSDATIRGVIWGTTIGAIVGIAGQLLMSKLNHKREIEKLAFEKKYTVYNKILEEISDIAGEFEDELNTEGKEIKALKFNSLIVYNQLIIPQDISDCLIEISKKSISERITYEDIMAIKNKLKRVLSIYD